MAIRSLQVYQCMPNHAAGMTDTVCQVVETMLCSCCLIEFVRAFAAQGFAVRSAGAACNRNGWCPFGYVLLLP